VRLGGLHAAEYTGRPEDNDDDEDEQDRERQAPTPRYLAPP
jgi:hypothetical protein